MTTETETAYTSDISSTKLEYISTKPADTSDISFQKQGSNSNESTKRLLNDINEEDCKKFKNDNGVETPMSKRQMKKILKQQKWLENKPLRRKFNKEKKKEKRKWKAEMKASGNEIPKVKTKKMSESTCKQRVVLDMSYDHLMSEKDLCKCSNQLLRCYGINRRMENPMQLYFCSFEGKIKETMAKHNGFEFWDINYITDSFDKAFNKEDIVYLTSDSKNIIDTMDENKIYIIGGLVDHNSCKGASLKVAESLGVAHARLPITENIDMKTRKILTINHVYEVLSKVVSGNSWKEALLSTLPKRKIFSAKHESSSDEENHIIKNDEEQNEHTDIINSDIVVEDNSKN
ncbi:tRNA methyltransferase 10 homolog A [Adelges cooleyi]|uniref:tRNA methyltransferase 10 homolog A n=1 Tax=Adelges cooleyi TaxID=133065 RepID=UPI00217F8470|nr:tRNA methyltransferase 10 homolog A [Adelges cooleyi]